MLAAFAMCAIAVPAHAAGDPHVQVELLNTIKTKKAKVGDKVKVNVTAGTELPDGRRLSAATLIVGQVREVQADSDGKSWVSISFDHPDMDGKKSDLVFAVRGAMLPGGPATAKSLDTIAPSEVPHEGPMQGRAQTVQDSAETQTRAPATSSKAAPVVESKYIAAKAGTVIGMPGVSLIVDDDGKLPSKFQSSSPNLELHSGLQLMLTVISPAK